MQQRKVKIAGTGKYLPATTVTDREMDRRLGQPDGWTLRTTDVAVRHFAGTETASEMGGKAAYAALNDAGLAFADIDCLVSTSGTMEQPIPCTAALIQRAMGQEQSGVPSFDINSTCLSFIAGLDVMSYLVAVGRYRRVLLVATEIASAGLDWSDKESAALFGDGAAAVVIEQADDRERSQIVYASIRTFSDGAHLSEIRGGGSKLPARQYASAADKDFLFDMRGQAMFKLASKLLPTFVGEMLDAAGIGMSDIRLVVPHQGSAMAMRLLQRKLGIAERQLMYISRDHGNTIAASIPMGLHEAIVQGRIGRGDRVLLLGTSAGFSIGGIVLEY